MLRSLFWPVMYWCVTLIVINLIFNTININDVVHTNGFMLEIYKQINKAGLLLPKGLCLNVRILLWGILALYQPCNIFDLYSIYILLLVVQTGKFVKCAVEMANMCSQLQLRIAQLRFLLSDTDIPVWSGHTGKIVGLKNRCRSQKLPDATGRGLVVRPRENIFPYRPTKNSKQHIYFFYYMKSRSQSSFFHLIISKQNQCEMIFALRILWSQIQSF